jgi:hypothetical protein
LSSSIWKKGTGEKKAIISQTSLRSLKRDKEASTYPYKLPFLHLIMSFDNLTMTSVSLQSGSLKAPPSFGRLPSLPSTSQYLGLDTTNSEKVQVRTNSHKSNNNNSDDDRERDRNRKPRATMPSPRKSVEFILHPPPNKRTKLNTAWTAKQVVDGK